MSDLYTNSLINATSPYLLQHAHNPVEWFEWGTAALEKARKEDKPILVSIGYSSCHWCHVMERESFEKKDVADVMNQYFVCIKVDREERPDIDQIYMDAVQALGVNGGWPLNVFLTPDQKPFFGGTYFSPQIWVQVLQNINKAFVSSRDRIENTAEELRMHLRKSDVARFANAGTSVSTAADHSEIFEKLQGNFDTRFGGMDRAPKFVMPSVWRYLLRYHHLSGNTDSLHQVCLTLDKISQGGIYDQIGGGFARYSVDGYWFAPHFEKMLYDNAQLISLFSEAYAITGNESYKQTVYETFDWLEREITSPEGGFFSALDADSEGVEGKFYIWTDEDFRRIMGEDASILAEYYNVKGSGNWEHGANILHRSGTDEEFLSKRKGGVKLDKIVETAKRKLLDARSNRIRPGLDDKIITSWNAMTTSGLIDASLYLGDTRFLYAAIRNMNFILASLESEGVLYRSFKGKRSATTGFLDDYAYVIEALIKLYQATFDEQWLMKAKQFAEYAITNFYDEAENFFFYTSAASEQLISRKKEVFDNVIPSSNSLMAGNLFTLGTMLDIDDWKNKSRKMTASLLPTIRSEPNYTSQWAIVAMGMSTGLKEVLVVDRNAIVTGRALQKNFNPFAVFMGSSGVSELALFEGKSGNADRTTIYVCENKTCKLPVYNIDEALLQIHAGHKPADL